MTDLSNVLSSPPCVGTTPLLLQASNLSFGYGGRTDPHPVIQSASLDLQKGESLALMGVSGTGKSTLLHLLGLLEQPCAGEMWMNGKAVSTISEDEKTVLRRHHIGFIYQFHHLLGDLTSLENVMMPLLIAGQSRCVAQKEAQVLLGAVHLMDRAQHYPYQLSGGQKQRVAIARSLANNPSLILADEPTGNLDEQNAQDVFDLLIRETKQRGLGMIIVTHNAALAQQCDRILYMSNGSLHPRSHPL